ncbi:branched-chain amino acid ABC transporter permease [Polaromonas sp. CG_9.11]|uniref:branched-chain amino acid ABC transporter permease n=1 Tax=Polaromonas sp. CG_9.11 TaxID=2787730 RepID=UPI0018CB4CAB|nr:branched-chain amino acid ABC transporter permease [Polaromonas sp. CG_9.11]MBG6078147.1 branched-chain amino acid transport system permease protein [Polaromonas sp. CG_9.11]
MTTQPDLVSSPPDSGQGFKRDVSTTAIVLALALLLPLLFDETLIGNLAYYLLWAFIAIGLAIMWGHGGILSFGQTAFFGLAGYAYGVLTINLGDSWIASWAGFFGSLVLAGAAGALLGYMICYGKVTGIFIGIVTLSITLVFETFMAQTAGPQWTIGKAHLNGFNGMSGMSPLSIPWFGPEALVLDGNRFYVVVVVLLAIVYLCTQRMLKSSVGLTLASIRENPRRAEMLGIDIRRYQMLVFIIGGVLAGLSGALYTIWGSYITPSSMGLNAAALPVIWVATAGRKSIAGTIVATAGLVWLSQLLAVYGSEYALILMGLILLFVVLVAPQGFLPWLLQLAKKPLVWHRSRQVSLALPEKTGRSS